MRKYVILAESQLIGGPAEYYVPYGLGFPSLRSLWGAVQNRQLYILRMYCKGCIPFSFSIFFLIYTTYRNNNTHIYRKRKLRDWTIFCTRFTFFTFNLTMKLRFSGRYWSAIACRTKGERDRERRALDTGWNQPALTVPPLPPFNDTDC